MTPNYASQPISLRNQSGEEVAATTFLVKSGDIRKGLWTSADYVGYIIRGLRAHGVGEVDPEYLLHVIDVALETNKNSVQQATEESRRIDFFR